MTARTFYFHGFLSVSVAVGHAASLFKIDNVRPGRALETRLEE